MAQVYADRVKETSTTTGTGTYSLAGASTGHQTFVDGVGDTNTCIYLATDDTDWEVGLGTVTDATPDTLSRDTIYSSSNGGSAVSWTAGTRSISCVWSAQGISEVDSRGVHELYFPASGMVAASTNGAAAGSAETTTNAIMISTLDFDAATDEFAQFSFIAPKSWNESTVTAKFAWSHAAASTYDVVWGLQGLAVGDSDALDASWGTAQTVTDSGGTTDDIFISAATSAITIAGTPAEGDLLIFRVYRDADNGSDTLDVDARLHGVTLYLTTNSPTDD